MYQKLSHCMQEIFLKIRYFERGLSKSLKKVNFIFSFELMGKIIKSKRGLELVTSCSSGYKIGLEKFLYPKITSANLCQPIHDIINYFTSFWIWKVWKGREKITKV